MKNNVRLVMFLLLILVPGVVLKAQSGLKMQLGYNINQPVGSFKDIISKTSYRGFMGDIIYDVNQNLGVGLGLSFADFYEKYPRAVYQAGEGHISAVISNSVQVMPVLAKGNYTFLKEGMVRPYLGVGAGINLINFEQYLGEFPSSTTVVKPAVTGEAGVKFAIGASGRTGLHAGAHYNYMPFKTSGYQNLNSWGAQVGLFFPLR